MEMSTLASVVLILLLYLLSKTPALIQLPSLTSVFQPAAIESPINVCIDDEVP